MEKAGNDAKKPDPLLIMKMKEKAVKAVKAVKALTEEEKVQAEVIEKFHAMEKLALMASYVGSVRVAMKDSRKAAKSEATSGQKGAWFIACQFWQGRTIDESLADMRNALKDAKLPVGKLEACRKLVGHALHLRRLSNKADGKLIEDAATAGEEITLAALANNTFPKDAKWHSIRYYARIEEIVGRTSTSIAEEWEQHHGSAIAKVKGEKNVPFRSWYIQKFGITADKFEEEVDVKTWDTQLLKASEPAKKNATAEATSDQLVLAFVKRSALLKVALERISQADRFSLTEMIESVNQEMRD